MHCLGYKAIKTLGSIGLLRGFVIFFLGASTKKEKPLLWLRKYLIFWFDDHTHTKAKDYFIQAKKYLMSECLFVFER